MLLGDPAVSTVSHFLHSLRKRMRDFLGCPLVKNLPANVGDTGLISGFQPRSHIPWGS